MSLPALQVNQAHYRFEDYMSKGRWVSLWHQLDETNKLQPKSVLEIGPGPGLFKRAGSEIGLNIKTLDPDPALNPDYVGSVVKLPMKAGEFDVVCAYQVLEHLPYEEALKAFAEMERVARKNIIISLPDAEPVWAYRLFIPKIGSKQWLVRRPFARPRIHQFDGQHHWEVNKANYSLRKVLADFSLRSRLTKTFRVFENPYHRFFVFDVGSHNSPSGAS